ncbi:uncharacterized protein LOC144435539 [Glandiceps talaboti]
MSTAFRSDRTVITGLARQSTLNRCIPAVNEENGIHPLSSSLQTNQLMTNQSIRNHSSQGKRAITLPTVVSIDHRTYGGVRDQTKRSFQALPQPTKLRWSAGSNKSRARVREPGEPSGIAPLNVELAPTKTGKDEELADTGRMVRPYKWMHESNYWPGIVKVSHEYVTGDPGLCRQANKSEVVPWVRTYKVKQNRNTVRKLLSSRSGESDAGSTSP